ncbi:hypothetical protein D3870_09795 [Noviherbaspirillum cavernae]|uniref:Uncharacterized protein n=1 Tax=Noviherbaspirillum cavernae TaxID=2320862 RepID=A0A418X1E8_9BURK|nr:hypothetical protein [Noviherbaspirillum cavernae]RJG06265.1 hypothetical protein D3870_09795 [Noviherbaspirillum cavernae]
MKPGITYELLFTNEAKARIKNPASIKANIPHIEESAFPITGEFIQILCDGQLTRFQVVSRDFIFLEGENVVIQAVLAFPL